MKVGFKSLLNLLSGSTSLCIATSLPLSVISDMTGLSFPILKDNVSFTGNLSLILNGDGRQEDVNNNLNKIFNFNKKGLLKNPNSINESNLETLKFKSEILNWNDWGSETFYQWEQNSSLQEIVYNKTEVINFESKNQLKNYFENNLSKILDNIPGAKLADAEFGIDDSGHLLIPVITSTVDTKLNLFSSTENIDSKLILKIPPEKISFNPQISINGSYGPNDQFQIKSKNVSLVCKITNLDYVPITFTNESIDKKEITLDDKGVTNNKVNLWENIQDEDIYKKLGWVKQTTTFDNHVDGSDMDISMLDEDLIYNDLGLSKSTDELLSVRIEFINGDESRNSTSDKYNGEYKIIIESIDKTSKDINGLKIKNYEVVSSINENNKSVVPLQLNVPDAYLIDTNLDGGKFMYITKEFFDNQSFEMGFKNNVAVAEFVLILRNLRNGNIFNSFINKIRESALKKDIKLSNGLVFTIGVVGVNQAMDQKYWNYVTLDSYLKKGFKFKKPFNLETQNKTKSYKYNTGGHPENVKFGMDLSTNKNEAAIWRNYDKTADQLSNELG
ncbi:hypothetical protein [Malacoplasma iowae]|uniref:p35 lipoprotein family protein n=1 Tax=Malacoplasma iowae DK-CPA TaxID=1394179 RepID=A0A084U4H1_MALIO|nr:hypothetical protein [Malacoplasma iowae]KFB07857.1 P35 lipoprotein family protein [Malacoplasma iowae DK-CPA]WPL36611.1 hypothetical protein QX179_04265 [Malacoplasma iowae]WPL37838.1 hypothetical protein QX182_05035 [Malacoplasma iowae]WPL41231.1 hypothetical protein QX184_01345 [Malacoplasma iowae]